MRILLGFREVAGNYSAIADGFREIGIEAEHWDLFRHRFNYDSRASRQRLLVTHIQSLHRQSHRCRDRGSRSGYHIWRTIAVVVRLPLLVLICTRFDSIIIDGFTGLLNHYELILFRLLRKKTIVIFHGSDSRPAYLSGIWIRIARQKDKMEMLLKITRRLRRNVRLVERYADFVVSTAGHCQLQTKPFIDVFAIGKPTKTNPYCDRIRHEPDVRENSRPLILLHFPSSRVAKGTETIQEIVGKWNQKNGNRLEFRCVTNVGNDLIQRLLCEADLVIDQLYSDIPVPSAAKEACAAGTPVIVAGYYVNNPHYRHMSLPPTIMCEPESLESALDDFFLHHSRYKEGAIEAKRIVMENWNTSAVAERYLDILSSRIPPSWWIDPYTVKYVGGVAVDQEEIARVFERLNSKYARSSFSLDGKDYLFDELNKKSQF